MKVPTRLKGSGPDQHPAVDARPGPIAQQWSRLPRIVRELALPAVVILVTFLYPQYVDSLKGLQSIGDFFPSVGSVVIMIVFTMMAVGLNIVVGYAGLLDLGYVAFYAAGAYTAAWLASQQFEQWNFHFGDSGVLPTLSGIHLSIWMVLPIAGIFTLVVGILIATLVFRPEGLLGERTPEGA